MKTRFSAVVAAALVAGLTLAVPAYSAGGGGSNDTVTKCKKGMIWDKVQKRCVPPKQGAVDDESIYEAGQALARAERYDEAIAVLSLAANKSDPRILNFLGFSHRKQGRLLVGFGYYEEALRIDPDYTLAREYLGEAHLQRGDLAAAKEQLAEIKKRCGTTCEEYVDLSGDIQAFEKQKKG
ncbi:tetratricopeptide repeat protein [Arvimicrobium flavum]|uniref:tetratricopeptide repeat protein n=1 Tax=Arvimicrobium flavum TaxID=3393320 RepID=UPI00237A1DC1|nr:tetratricopeptide repeat protein [Mesorhizobium shangrilense]